MRGRRHAVVTGTALAIVGFASPALATTFTVNKTGDTHDTNPGNGVCRDSSPFPPRCSLRAAIEETNATPGAIHVIDLGAATYSLTLGELVVSGNQIIRGVSAAQTIVRRGSGLIRPFRVNTGGRVDFMSLTIRDGVPEGANLNPGGGLYVGAGEVHLYSVNVSNNVGTPGGGIAVDPGAFLELSRVHVFANRTNLEPESSGVNWTGGGLSISPGASVSIWGSTFSGNEGQIGGSIYNAGYMELSNSTLSGNISRSSGGGIFQIGADSESHVRFTTITENQCNKAGSLFTNQGGGISVQSGWMDIGSSIIAKNADTRGWGDPLFSPDCGTNSPSGIFSWGYNLLGNVGLGCFFDSWTGDQIGSGNASVDPLLGSLSNHGGQTPTHAPIETSPAVDTNFNDAWWFRCEDVYNLDQRDFVRPTDGNNDGVAACDKGALERQNYANP